MKSKRSIIVFWALFLVPTLIITGIAFRLLSHEQDRINSIATDALSQRAKTISGTIHITIDEVLENLTTSLLAIDPVDSVGPVDQEDRVDIDNDKSKLEDNLLTLEEINPLVRNVFIYKDQKLEYPVKGLESTLEERHFITRYDSFFSGRLKFDFSSDQNQISDKELQKSNGISNSYYGSEKYGTIQKKKNVSSRQKLVALSKIAKKEPISKQQNVSLNESEQSVINKSGWIPWFSENRLHLLGWVQQHKNGTIYGIELELMTLLSRLIVDFPDISEQKTALVLMDGNGNFMHHSGTISVDPGQQPVERIAVSSFLPHWQIGVFTGVDGFGTTKGFLYVSMILLAILIVAIISGGILLTRLTLANMKDAREKTSFVSSVSHELKTPLTSIRMYAELLLSKRVQNEEKIQTYLSTIVNESSRLTRLINNILDFAKLEQKKKKYQLENVEIDKFLKTIIKTHSIRIQNQNFKIKTLVEKDNYKVKIDKDALEQVILNLLDNALKYADKGEFIKFVLINEESSILLKICDDGPGIPKSQQTRIFEKFHRIDNSLTSHQPGSGLGLSIAKQIMNDLKGDLFYEPLLPNGSCFIIRINNHDTD